MTNVLSALILLKNGEALRQKSKISSFNSENNSAKSKVNSFEENDQ